MSVGGWGRLAVLACLVGVLPLARASNNYSALDLGVFASNLDLRRSAPSGYTTKVSSINALVRFRRALSLGKGFFFEPSFGTLIPWRASADGNAKAFTSYLGLDFTLPIWRFLHFRVGPGVQWGLIVSSGGTVDLNNGGPDLTSTFYSPGGLSNQFTFTVEGGLELRFSKRISLEIELVVPDLASKARRRYHGLMALGVTL